MKKMITLFAFILISASSYAFVVDFTPQQILNPEQFSELNPEIQELGLNEFLAITPKEFKKRTGKKLGIKNAIKLKAAQKVVKNKLKRKGGDGITPGLYILLAILGLGWIAMGILSDWSGSDWIVNLILTVLCWLPGLIHALVKKKDYY